jgi:putative heme iron utilization protein
MDQPTPPAPHRLAVRRLMRASSKASLATLLVQPAWPYASLVTVATSQDGSPILLLSALSDHTRNLAADARVSLLFDGTAGFANPQQGPRVTLLGRAVADPDPLLRRRFLARHPGAALYAGFGDFAIYRVIPERAHLVGGFARAVWLDDRLTVGGEVAAALAQAEPELLEQVNGDPTAADAMARAVPGCDGSGWRVVAVDADGCDLGREEEVIRLPFDASVEDVEGAQRALAALSRRANPEG